MSDSAETGDWPHDIRIKRIYRAARRSDGKRILVDRLWPRGVSRDRARLYAWCQEVAPSNQLRRWFHARPQCWEEFCSRYRAELVERNKQVSELAGLTASGVVTLLYASRDETCNHAVVLREVLLSRLSHGSKQGE